MTKTANKGRVKSEKKEVTPIEYKRYLDQDTGEVHNVPVIVHEGASNKDFEMIFYGHFLQILNDLGNKKIKVLQYIIKNREKVNNTFVGTQSEIAKGLGVTIVTVNRTLQLLEDKQVIKRKTGIIYIDSDLICDGRFKGRIMHVYNGVDNELTAEERKAKIEREIKYKETELKELERIKNGIIVPPPANQSTLFQ